MIVVCEALSVIVGELAGKIRDMAQVGAFILAQLGGDVLIGELIAEMGDGAHGRLRKQADNGHGAPFIDEFLSVFCRS